VVNTLLTELDGLTARKSVYVIAATNRPDMIDPAMCRPGRLDKLLYVDLPNASERAEIVRTLLKKIPLAADAREGAVEALIHEDRCEGYSGADLAAVVREAGVLALRAKLGSFETMSDDMVSPTGDNIVQVELGDFVKAVEKIYPSVSAAQRKKYAGLRNKFAGLPLRSEGRESARGATGGEAQEL